MATPVGRPRTLVILATSFNRRELTISALHSAERSVDAAGLVPTVVLADADSSDGTADAVEAEFDFVRVFRVSKEHYWAKGMRVAMASAESRAADFVLWLNDDTLLDTLAVSNLVATADAMPLPGIVAGAVRDAVTGERTYGGWVNSSRWGLRFAPAPVSLLPSQCDTLNGNVVLISSGVLDRVGILDSRFTHGLADLDYGLRARRMGVPILQAPGFVGTCSHNSTRGTWRDHSLSMRQRVHLMMTPKGLPPGEWMRFQLRHGRLLAPINILRPWLRLLVDASGLGRSRIRNGPADRHDRTGL
jgi:GT2 family glycosyltransferase